MHDHEVFEDVGSTKLKALEEASKELQQKLIVATQSEQISAHFKKSEALHKKGAGPFSLCNDSMYPPRCAARMPFKLSGHFDI